MKYMRVGAPGAEIPIARTEDGRHLDLRDITADIDGRFATLIYELSQVTVLEPGDLINTGTPEGVALSGRFPYLAEGDLMEMEIDGLGRQRQKVTRA